MALPEKWEGIFWSKETGGDMIVDLNPNELATELSRLEKEERLELATPFYLAGAAIDLFVNGMGEQSQGIIEVGKREFPENPWAELEEKLQSTKPALEEYGAQQLVTLAGGIISDGTVEAFGGLHYMVISL